MMLHPDSNDFNTPLSYASRYGRIKIIDPRSYNYSMREKLLSLRPKAAPLPTHRRYEPYYFYEQGKFPYCTEFMLYNYFDLPPVLHSRKNGKWKGFPYPIYPPRHFYCLAQAVDPYPGGCGATFEQDAYQGTSVTAMLSVAKDAGILSEYHWDIDGDVNIIIECLLTHGPVMMGTDWMEGMELRDVLRPEEAVMTYTGQLLGGHAYNLIGADMRKERKGREIEMMNNWGKKWANGGCAYMSLDTLHQIITADGAEAAIATEIK